ncbi:hypothetical protein K439DRAFT_1623619 [Ramaria rubella]|nr:hypothetical protein K439DRAFT_1623619 [Ramaria rubella]
MTPKPCRLLKLEVLVRRVLLVSTLVAVSRVMLRRKDSMITRTDHVMFWTRKPTRPHSKSFCYLQPLIVQGTCHNGSADCSDATVLQNSNFKVNMGEESSIALCGIHKAHEEGRPAARRDGSGRIEVEGDARGAGRYEHVGMWVTGRGAKGAGRMWVYAWGERGSARLAIGWHVCTRGGAGWRGTAGGMWVTGCAMGAGDGWREVNVGVWALRGDGGGVQRRGGGGGGVQEPGGGGGGVRQPWGGESGVRQPGGGEGGVWQPGGGGRQPGGRGGRGGRAWQPGGGVRIAA